MCFGLQNVQIEIHLNLWRKMYLPETAFHISFAKKVKQGQLYKKNSRNILMWSGFERLIRYIDLEQIQGYEAQEPCQFLDTKTGEETSERNINVMNVSLNKTE